MITDCCGMKLNYNMINLYLKKKHKRDIYLVCNSVARWLDLYRLVAKFMSRSNGRNDLNEETRIELIRRVNIRNFGMNIVPHNIIEL